MSLTAALVFVAFVALAVGGFVNRQIMKDDRKARFTRVQPQ